MVRELGRIAMFFGWAAMVMAGPRTAGSIRVDSTLVLIPVSVTDAQNHPVPGLGLDQFRVFEGKAEHQVLQLFRDEAPISVGIVFDSSGSMKGSLPQARIAAAEFMKSSNPEDEFFLVNFSSRAEVTVPFTTDTGDIADGIGAARAQGKTALLDAVYLAVDYLKGARYSRRALLVISDGVENDSRYREDELRAILQESDAWVYTIGLYPGAAAVLPEGAGDDFSVLRGMAEATGGRHYAIRSANELPDAAASAGLALRNRYVLAYHPAVAADGRYHPVTVKLVERRGRHLTWRPGYWAPNR
jgi:Ca-activated chloride channel homolog